MSSASTSSPINVLDLRDTFEIGGPGKTIIETFRAIDRARFALHLAVFLRDDESEDTPFIRAAREHGMPVHVIRGSSQYDPRMIWRVAHLVRSLNVHILHSHEVKSDAIAYLSSPLHRAAIVTTLHGWIGNSRKQRIMIAADQRLVRRFDRVIAVSENIRQRLLGAGVRPAALRLVHNAIVLDRYRPVERRGHLAELLGRQPEGAVIVSIGRLSPEKGHLDLVDALAMVAAKGMKVTAVVAGDGPGRQALTERIHARGLAANIHLPGYVSQPQQILGEADLMVLPSHTEGLPNAALEALAMEVPVLATRVGGTPEVIADNDTGRLVEARQPEALAAGMLEFLADREGWKGMARRGRAMVQKRFSFDARTRTVEALYDELVMERSA